jgi:predicted SAM-dependent methyltransferase
MSYIDYTYELLRNYGHSNENILVLCPRFVVSTHVSYKRDEKRFACRKAVETNDPDIDLNNWLVDYISNNDTRFDLVIASRVLEHLPMRNIDYYLYNIYNIMKKDGLLIVTVPDMQLIFERLREEYQKERPNWFLINRLNFELFGEGEHQWDFHKTFTTEISMENILEREKLFEVKDVVYTYIETDLVPPYLEYHARRL